MAKRPRQLRDIPKKILGKEYAGRSEMKAREMKAEDWPPW